ncbi:MAG TPA: NAD-dependent epimerase/dehydratase family protein [Vicinamibacteria bacterium]|nr:NAD-dependent epimerase/dehydratase family protein [Vicinamibacteria bacterium]
MKRIAVTGANGFIGRHLVRRAVSGGYEVVGVVRSERAAQVVRASGGQPCELLGRDPEALVRALDGCLAIVHLAQIGAERAGSTYEAVNVGFTERVLEDARHAGVPRAVYFSGLGVARYGMSPRCSNPYFLSKLAAETLLFRSGIEGTVFRPSYVVGPGDGLVPLVLRAMVGGELERPGDGSYRVQPIAVGDAAEAVIAAVSRPCGSFPTVFDLVGPEPLPYAALLERLAAVARRLGRPAHLRLREVPLAEAEAKARAGGWQGLLSDELDCLVCDEVSDPLPLVALLGRPLVPLDEALASAIRGEPAD